MPVYAMERGERRELPQMPCPEVHPLPMPEPAPTRRPAMTVLARLTPGSAIWFGSQTPVQDPGGDEAAEEGEAPGGEISVLHGAFERAGDPEDAAGQEELTDSGDAEDAAADESRVGLEVEFDGHWCG